MIAKLAVAVFFLSLNYYAYHFLARDAVVPARETFESFPMTLGSWSCAQQGEIPPDVWDNLGATDVMLCDYFRTEPAAVVSVYLGYHATQVREEGGGSGENSIHPPAHCLPGSGWSIIDNRTVLLEDPNLPGGRGHVKRMLIAKGEARQLVYYWYQSRGRVIAEDWQKIVYVGLDRATRGRTDGALVRFTVPVATRSGEDDAERAFREVAPQVIERLTPYVPL